MPHAAQAFFLPWTQRKFIETESIKVGADKMSSITNYEDRTTVFYLAMRRAALLEPTEDGLGIQDSILKSDGAGYPYLHQKAGGSRRPASIETITNKEHYLYQEGSTVFTYLWYKYGTRFG